MGVQTSYDIYTQANVDLGVLQLDNSRMNGGIVLYPGKGAGNGTEFFKISTNCPLTVTVTSPGFAAARLLDKYFWFEINNPGDVVVAQQLKAPAEPPANLPRAEDLVPDKLDPGFMLYTEPMTGGMDPYAYYPW